MEEITAGALVVNPRMPQWGTGKVLAVDLKNAKVHFRANAKQDVVTLQLSSLELAPDADDDALDHLPEFVDGAFAAKGKWTSLEAGLERFKRKFPLGFDDPRYLAPGDDKDESEREYKVRARDQYRETLANGKAEALLTEGRIEELSSRVYAVLNDNGINLIHHTFEKAAYKDALMADPNATSKYLEALVSFISAAPSPDLFERLADGLIGLPSGRSRVTTWPILTLMPFLARPDAFVFVKPTVIQEFADRYRQGVHYDSALTWGTYDSVQRMYRLLLRRLSKHGARDFIDVQSFMYVVCEYTEGNLE